MTPRDIIQCIRELFGTSDFIPLHAPTFRGKEKEYLVATIESTFVSSVGAYVDQFELLMSQFTGTRKAVAVVNGTCALQIALHLVGVKAGEEVLTQALTFVATANAIHYNGATPVFLDVDLDTLGLSPSALQQFLDQYGEKREDGTYNRSSGKRIAACLPMHTFGFMARIEGLAEICKDWNIPLVEDAAEALGSTSNGRAAGSFGQIGVFSFNGNKIVTCGGGGALVTMDEKLGKRGKFLTTTAKIPHPWEYEHSEVGYNFRLPNLNAALACAQLEQLEGFLRNKRALFESYQAFFADSNFVLLGPRANTTSNHWLNCIVCPTPDTRDELLKVTNEEGVMTRPIWKLMFKLPMYKDCQRDHQKNACFLESRVVNIPSSVRT